MMDETQENLGICFVGFTEGSITFVQAYVTLGGKTQKKKIGDAGLASQTLTTVETNSFDSVSCGLKHEPVLYEWTRSHSKGRH